MSSTLKMISVIMIVLVVIFLSISSYGESQTWDCPDCGRTGNTGNYCGGCAHPAPWLESTIDPSASTPSLAPTPMRKATPTPAPGAEINTVNPGTKVGDCVVLGKYEQDGDINNGAEPIEWLVLAVENNSALLLSKYALDSVQYDQTKEGQTWEKCYLRKWLNTDFINLAFISTERKFIKQTLVDNKKMTAKDPHTGTQWVPSDAKGGNNTKDYVYILSGDEIDELLDTEIARQCKATLYVEQQGALLSTVNSNVWWWLRSPKSVFGAYLVNSMGKYENYEQNMTVGFTVRPAMWVILQ